MEELITSQTVLKEILKRVPQEEKILFQIEAGNSGKMKIIINMLMKDMLIQIILKENMIYYLLIKEKLHILLMLI